MYLVSCLNSYSGGTSGVCLQIEGIMVAEHAARTTGDLPCPAA